MRGIVVFLLFAPLACSSADVAYEAEHLFTLHSHEAEVSYNDRPTPTIAVNSDGDIAFPIREFLIGIYSPDGKCIRTIIDSANVYPKEMLFDDNEVLQVLSYDERRVIKYRGDGRFELPLDSLEDWWRYSDARIATYLATHELRPLVWENKGPLGTFLQFPYYIEILVRSGKLYINGHDLVIYDITKQKEETADDNTPAGLFGILSDRYVLMGRRRPYAYVHDCQTKEHQEISCSSAYIGDTLPRGFHGNFPETNKRNLRQNWYWQRETNIVYRVVQLSTGFYFYRISFLMD